MDTQFLMENGSIRTNAAKAKAELVRQAAEAFARKELDTEAAVANKLHREKKAAEAKTYACQKSRSFDLKEYVKNSKQLSVTEAISESTLRFNRMNHATS